MYTLLINKDLSIELISVEYKKINNSLFFKRSPNSMFSRDKNVDGDIVRENYCLKVCKNQNDNDFFFYAEQSVPEVKLADIIEQVIEDLVNHTMR
jgi:hypothetical protein